MKGTFIVQDHSELCESLLYPFPIYSIIIETLLSFLLSSFNVTFIIWCWFVRIINKWHHKIIFFSQPWNLLAKLNTCSFNSWLTTQNQLRTTLIFCALLFSYRIVDYVLFVSLKKAKHNLLSVNDGVFIVFSLYVSMTFRNNY